MGFKQWSIISLQVSINWFDHHQIFHYQTMYEYHQLVQTQGRYSTNKYMVLVMPYSHIWPKKHAKKSWLVFQPHTDKYVNFNGVHHTKLVTHQPANAYTRVYIYIYMQYIYQYTDISNWSTELLATLFIMNANC